MFEYSHIVLLVLLSAAVGVGQVPPHISVSRRSPSEQSLKLLLDRISGLPVEYKADLGFSVIDASASSLSPARERALLDDIFHSAGGAHYPYMLVDAAASPGVDTLSHVTTNMLSMLQLDTLDIQMRAVKRALKSTPRFATHLWEEVNLDEVRTSCKQGTVEDVSEFYKTAAIIVQDQRIKTVFKGDKVSYVQSLASGMRIPAQIAPIANLIAQMRISPVQLEQVETAFVSSLDVITASDREMTAAEEGGGVTNAIKLLSAKLTKSNISSEPLLMAFRRFLLRSLTSERCADHSLDRAEMAQRFNALLPSRMSEGLLSASELNPKSIGQKASYEVIPFSDELLPQFQRIRAAHEARFAEEYRLGQPGTIEPEPSDVDDVVKYAVQLEPSGAECSVCDFHAKGGFFMMLVDSLPPGHQLERAIHAEVDYLSFNPIQKDDPIAWLTLFRQLLTASRKPTKKATAALTAQAKAGSGMTPWGLPSPEATTIRDGLRGASDPIIATYLSADDLLHLPYLTFSQQAEAK